MRHCHLSAAQGHRTGGREHRSLVLLAQPLLSSQVHPKSRRPSEEAGVPALQGLSGKQGLIPLRQGGMSLMRAPPPPPLQEHGPHRDGGAREPAHQRAHHHVLRGGAQGEPWGPRARGLPGRRQLPVSSSVCWAGAWIGFEVWLNLLWGPYMRHDYAVGSRSVTCATCQDARSCGAVAGRMVLGTCTRGLPSTKLRAWMAVLCCIILLMCFRVFCQRHLLLVTI